MISGGTLRKAVHPLDDCLHFGVFVRLRGGQLWFDEALPELCWLQPFLADISMGGTTSLLGLVYVNLGVEEG